MIDLEIVQLHLSFFDPLNAYQIMTEHYYNQYHAVYKLHPVYLFPHHLEIIFPLT